MRRGVTRAIELARSHSAKRRNGRRSERILVAVKLTEEGGELVTWTLTHGSRSGDTVTVIHVVEPCSLSATQRQVAKWERQKKDMLNALGKLVTYCRTHYYVPHLSTVVQVVESKSIGNAIVEEAQNLEATKVIVGKHKSGPLVISSRKMTDLGRLCVQNLEPYCDVVIVRKGKVLVRKPGMAKFRRSLETLILTTKKQELYDKFEETNDARQLVLGGCLADWHEGLLGLKESSPDSDNSLTKGRLSSPLSLPSSGKSSDHLSLKFTNSSLDSSFCSSGLSSVGSENSPNSVLRDSHHGKIDKRDKIDGGRLLPPQLSCLRDTASSIALSTSPFSSQAEWLKSADGPVPRTMSRSSPNSLESVPELSELQAEGRKDQEARPEEDRALVVFSAPQLEDRKEDDTEQQLAIVCVSAAPELEEDRKDGDEVGSLALVCLSPRESDGRKEEEEPREEPWRAEEGAIVLAGIYPPKSENREDEEDEGEEEGALVCFANCSPPQFARTCSALRYNLSEDGLQSLSKDVKLELPELRRFNYEELRVAADDFAQRNVVGTGGASTVYKAHLSDGSMVALKRLVDNMAGEKEFMMEMMMLICTLNHPNLVTMIGFCAEGSHRLIAYKLLTRGSLERNLHNVADSRKLNWEQRQKVAFGAARGLAYLHAFSPKPIVHRDIKTSNILLADDFTAQISDFGLARWLSEGDSTDDQVTCAGTFGYLAPECLMYGGFNEQTDVFAFGVVLLELISGRRPMDESLPETEKSLVLWARTLQQNGKTHCLVDGGLTDINPQQFKRMMYAAFLCVQVSPEDRPTMDRVVRLLDPNCSYSPAILQPNISAPPFMSMPDLNASRELCGPLSITAW